MVLPVLFAIPAPVEKPCKDNFTEEAPTIELPPLEEDDGLTREERRKLKKKRKRVEAGNASQVETSPTTHTQIT